MYSEEYKVEEVSEAVDFSRFDSLSAEDLVREFGKVKLQKECADEKAKEIGKLYDFLRLVKIPQVFEERGISLLKVPGVGRCQLAGDLHASIKSDKKEEAYEYLRDSGRGALITESVNASTLKAAIKEAIIKGEELPEELFKVSPFTRASLVKG